MKILIKNADIYFSGAFKNADLLVCDGVVEKVSENIECDDGAKIISGKKLCVFPGLVDVHVHLREPGFKYKETVSSGTDACAHGGVTHVCSMPNLNPVPDSVENLAVSLTAIDKDACIDVRPFGAITVGEKGEVLSDLEGMAQNVCGRQGCAK